MVIMSMEMYMSAMKQLASKVTGLDIAKLCFEENEEINITEYTQIAMLTTEAAIYAALKKAGKEPANGKL